MRIATFNILNGRVPGGEVDEVRFADAIRSLDVDVLGLQEVDRNQPRSRHADLTRVAAAAMGAVESRFAAALSGTPGTTWSAPTGQEHPDSAAYGVALLSRLPVSSWQEVRLPPAPLRVPHRFHGRRWPTLVHDEPRVAVMATIETPTGRLQVVNTHLSFLPWWNGVQLRRLVRALRGLDDLVLMGDLNMAPGRAHALTRMRPLASGDTFPADAPHSQIDHVLVRGSLAGVGGGPVPAGISDHLALVAETRDGG
jgi:endonuclease/exonuclease/phosphatase family metal-dependent hydrolase